jgi:hypothetical protein
MSRRLNEDTEVREPLPTEPSVRGGNVLDVGCGMALHPAFAHGRAGSSSAVKLSMSFLVRREAPSEDTLYQRNLIAFLW